MAEMVKDEVIMTGTDKDDGSKILDREILLPVAHELVSSLEQEDYAGAQAAMERLADIRESTLYREVGRMTRELHDAIADFADDARLMALTTDELPDAKERLAHVIKMTEQAANQTLGAVEDIMPMVKQMGRSSNDLAVKWDRFLGREMPVEEFRDVARGLKIFLEKMQGDADRTYSMANDVLMAQNFQDLTGQIIKRVIALIEEMESKLVNLLRISGQKHAGSLTQVDEHKIKDGDIGPHVLGRKSKEAVSGQDEVDDLLSSLGF